MNRRKSFSKSDFFYRLVLPALRAGEKRGAEPDSLAVNPLRGENKMKLKIDTSSFEWWFWTITLVFIIAALSGWTPGYTAVIMVSLVQTIFIGVRTGSATSFPSQVRIVYFAYTLLGLWQVGRFYCYALLAVGTVRSCCSIAVESRWC
jgi:hypothetical protein